MALSCLQKVQIADNTVLPTMGKNPGGTRARDLYHSFSIPTMGKFIDNTEQKRKKSYEITETHYVKLD
jgi:hypothetical protein